MSQFGKLFYGVTPSDQRKFLRQCFEELPHTGRFFNPACGVFTLAKTAISAGIEPEQIYTSDVSLFSSILGYYYDDGHLDRLDVTMLPLRLKVAEAEDEEEEAEWLEIEDTASVYDDIDNPARQAAYLFWVIKLKQLRYNLVYERVVVDEYLQNRDHYLDAQTQALEQARETYEGITYRERDVRQILNVDFEADDIVAVNPPHFSDDYTDMFATGEVLKWDISAPQFELEQEFPSFFAGLRSKDCTAFSGVHEKAKAAMEDDEVHSFEPGEVMFAMRRPSRWEYWGCTTPDRIPKKLHNRVLRGTTLDLRPYKNLPVWGEDDILFPDSNVRVVQVGIEHALYYRQLWFHKIGISNAELPYLILVDGKVFATVGFSAQQLSRFLSDSVEEVFGCCAQTESRYFNLNLLIELIISTGEMKEHLYNHISQKNRMWTLRGINTTCFSKYRHLKSQKQVSELMSREKRDDGTYHLRYHTPFREDEGFDEQVPKYLRMLETKLKRRAIDDAYKRHS